MFMNFLKIVTGILISFLLVVTIIVGINTLDRKYYKTETIYTTKDLGIKIVNESNSPIFVDRIKVDTGDRLYMSLYILSDTLKVKIR